MISAAVDEDAEEGDTVNASVEDLTYNLDGLSLEVENAALYVGWDTNVDILPDPDPFLIETSFSFDIPVGFSAQSTDSETMSGDESVQLLEEDPVEEGMGMESEIRVVESREDDGTSPIEGIPTTNKFEDSGGGVLITALIIGAIAFVGLSYGLKQDKN